MSKLKYFWRIQLTIHTKRHFGVAIAVLSALAAIPARADVIYDTTGGWNGSNSINAFGSSSTQTYGQTILAPADPNTNLESFTFELQGDGGNTASISYQAFVYAWDGSEASGPALFTSSVLSVTPPASGFTAVNVNTGGTALTANQAYVLFLSTAGAPSSSGQAAFGYLGTDTTGADGYSSGNFVFLNNTTTSQFTSTAWSDPTSYGGNAAADLAFIADFSSVPEPSTLATSGLLGLVGLGYLMRRRQVRP